MPEEGHTTQGTDRSSVLLYFTPRQVLLSSNHPAPPPSMKQPQASPSTDTLAEAASKTSKPDHNALLSNSIALYLQRRGFKKTLKSFRSEANVKDESLEDLSLDLEKMCLKYLETCDHLGTTLKSKKQDMRLKETKKGGHTLDSVTHQTEQVNGEAGNASSAGTDKVSEDGNSEKPAADTQVPDLEVKSKKKKNQKISDSFTNGAGEANPKVSKVSGNSVDECRKSKNCEKTSSDEPVCELEIKVKEKKRKKSSGTEQVSGDAVKPSDCDVIETSDLKLDESTEKLKDKKKKKKPGVVKNTSKHQKVESLPMVTEEESKDIPSAEGKSITEKEMKVTSKKKSKKNEKLAGNREEPEVDLTEENHDKTAGKSSKKRKRLDGEKNDNQPDEGVVPDESKRRKTEVQEENHNEKNSTVKSAAKKSNQKQSNGSTEPKTVNAFQRVKIDEVEFVDERLQDNSYWAKDGADSGYGAKAQEVLGQVKGRDFRHEKTKKKRGSYRGGQIDMNSHSIKFNYSDEE